MDEQDLLEILRTRLDLVVTSSSEYTGDTNDGGSLYSDSKTIQLRLDGEVISEALIE